MVSSIPPGAALETTNCLSERLGMGLDVSVFERDNRFKGNVILEENEA
jgi:hypothetical protein